MYWLHIAAGLSTLTLFVHFFGGGRSVADPLLESSLGAEAKYTSYYCWHIVTIVIFSLALAYFLAAQSWASMDLAVFATFLALAFTVWSGILTVWKKQKIMTLPQWILFLPITLAGLLGIWSAD